MLKFELYDLDSKSEKLTAHDFLGRLECSLASIVSAPGKQFVSVIKDGPSKGKHALKNISLIIIKNTVMTHYFLYTRWSVYHNRRRVIVHQRCG